MNSFKSYFVSRWLTAFLCLSLLVSLLASSSGFILRRAAAQEDATLKVGAKFGANLPELARVRYRTVAQPKAPVFTGSSNPCFDCKQSGSLADTFSETRSDPSNRTGEPGVDLLSQNTRWAQPLINLKGRADLDLKLSLVYNSLVWTKAGSQIAFDPDRGQPSPGFRLGFPTIQPRYRNTQTGKFAYLLITPEGKRIELRQVDERNVYESIDSSLLQMVDNGANGALLLQPDGSRLSFRWLGGQLQCIEVKDRNGNYITADYDNRGYIKSITDTVGRTFLFFRDNGGNLVAIRQKSSGAENRVLATFQYSDLVVQTNFSGLKVVGPMNGSAITVLTQVGVPDGSRYQFDYTSWGQVWRITKYAPDGNALTYISYNLPQDAAAVLDDVPRATELHNWSEGENDVETITRIDIDPSAAWGQATLPDGSIHKEFFATSGWQRGLTTGTEDWAGKVLQKRTTIEFTQDDTSLSYPLNPRPQETISEDAQGHRSTTRIEYTSYGLPNDTSTADGSGPVRHIHLEYDLDTQYTKRHILGLVRERTVYGVGGVLLSKTSYDYDLIENLVDQGLAIQHDNVAYGSRLITGRGLLTAIKAWNADKPAKSIAIYLGYNTNGSLAFRRDASGQQINFSYTDDFADRKNRGAMAFVTASTGSGGKRSSTQFDYETGAPVRTQSWQGVVHTFSYDGARRLVAMADENTGASMRRIYDEGGTLIATFRKSSANFKELGSYTVLDGLGRVRAKAMDPLTKTGGYRGVLINRDMRGRVINQTKPTKMSSSWVVAEPVAFNLPASSHDQQSMVASIRDLGDRLIAGVNDLMNAVAPTAYAQDCTNGYYCDDPPSDVEWGTMDYNGIGDSVDIDGVTYSVEVSFEPTAVQLNFINDGGIETDWGAQFALTGLFMGIFEAVGGVFAEEAGGAVEGEVADTVGEVAPDPNKLHHIFDNPDHDFGPFVSQYGGQVQAFQAIQNTVQGLGLPEGGYEMILNIGGTNVWVRGTVINGIAMIGSASARITP
jgi:YD repeat-containing protein